jgi:capsule polysaccharide export protein KpsE/RkpR
LLFIEEFGVISSMKTEENTSLLLAEKDALISALKEQNLLLQAQNKVLQELVAQLQLQVKQLQKKIFGKSSERFVDDPQPYLPGLEPQAASIEQGAEEEVVQVPAHEKKKAKSTPKNTISYPDNLPVDRQVIDLPEE